MGICPKCNSQVESNASVCSKCNALLDVSTDGFGTIYADPSKLSEADQSREPNLGGTLSPSDFAGSQNPQSDLSQPVNNSDDVVADSEQSIAPNGAESDEHKTVVLPGGHDSDGDNEHRTWIMDDESLRAASAGSKGKSGSSGQLRRVWEEAIGSSGKDSKQSLRYERAEASDSVFRRVATRYDKKAANFLGFVWIASLTYILA